MGKLSLSIRIKNQVDAFAKYGWTSAIRGVEGRKVEGMTAHTFKTDEGDIVLKCPTEVLITDRREKELNDLGFVAIVNSKGSNFAAFLGVKPLINRKFTIRIMRMLMLNYHQGYLIC